MAEHQYLLLLYWVRIWYTIHGKTCTGPLEKSNKTVFHCNNTTIHKLRCSGVISEKSALKEPKPNFLQLQTKCYYKNVLNLHSSLHANGYRKRGKFHWAKLSQFLWCFRETRKFFLSIFCSKYKQILLPGPCTSKVLQ